MTADEFGNPLYVGKSSPDDIEVVTAEDVTDNDKPNQSDNVQVHTVLAEVHAIEYRPDQSDSDRKL